MKNHRKWYCIIAYFKKIPINNDIVERIKILLKEDKNILIMIKKEEESKPEFTQKEKFNAICELFPNETKMGKIIVSKVPDINEVENIKL